MVDCLEQAASASQKARNLVMKANGNGGPDNITVILAEIQVETPLPRADGAPGNS
jgi:serine/threonine protein phosphatase PrpC